MAKRKYDAVVAGLPRDFGEEPAYQERVNIIKETITMDPEWKTQASHVARAYVKLRAEKDVLNDELSALNLELTAISQLLVDQFDAEGVSIIHVDGQGVSVWQEPAAKVVDREAYRQWCLADPDLARQMMLWPSTTASLTKKMLLEERKTPPGIEATALPKIRLGSA